VNRLLVTGAGGLLGAAIGREFSTDWAVTALDHAALDITSRNAVASAIAAARPHVVVNCAAFNDVDAAEDNAPAALAVNAFGVQTLSELARRAGAKLVHYSTDFVFDGQASSPYAEDDRPNPRSTYAASKLLGDWFALEHPAGYVLRVESLFGHPGVRAGRVGSLGMIVSRIRAGVSVPVFTDRTVSPSYTADIARATRELLALGASPGLYHCVNSGAATWREIAAEAARLLKRPLTIDPITLETVALKAQRPKYCALSNEKLRTAGVPMPAWQDALGRYLVNSQLPTSNSQRAR
jgi:dTDP-4-dehydrorhamnose reductase